MPSFEQARQKLRGELEAAAAPRYFGSGWISGVLGLVLGPAGFSLVLARRLASLESGAGKPAHRN